MYMRPPFTLRLAHVELTQFDIGLWLSVKLIVLERGALAKTNSYERPGQAVGPPQIGDSNLNVNDILSGKPRYCCRTNVINTNRRVVDHITDTPCDLREVADPLRLIRGHHHRARLS